MVLMVRHGDSPLRQATNTTNNTQKDSTTDATNESDSTQASSSANESGQQAAESQRGQWGSVENAGVGNSRHREGVEEKGSSVRDAEQQKNENEGAQGVCDEEWRGQGGAGSSSMGGERWWPREVAERAYCVGVACPPVVSEHAARACEAYVVCLVSVWVRLCVCCMLDCW